MLEGSTKNGSLCRCPKCGSAAYAIPTYSLLLTLRDWPLMLAAAGLALFAGGLFELSGAAAAFFSVAACLPIAVIPLRKGFCTRCSMEFISRELSLVPSIRQPLSK